MKDLKFEAGKEYNLYTDIYDSGKAFALKMSESEIVENVFRDYNYNRHEIPDSIIIKAFKVGKVGEKDNYTDLYDIIDFIEFDYSVNKLYSPAVWVIPEIKAPNALLQSGS